MLAIYVTASGKTRCAAHAKDKFPRQLAPRRPFPRNRTRSLHQALPALLAHRAYQAGAKTAIPSISAKRSRDGLARPATSPRTDELRKI